MKLGQISNILFLKKLEHNLEIYCLFFKIAYQKSSQLHFIQIMLLGHHSVIGRPNSGGLSFPEYVVYRGEMVRFVFN